MKRKWLCWVIGHEWDIRKGKWTWNPKRWSIGQDWIIKREDILPENGHVTCQRCGKREVGTRRVVRIWME
jgi:hypothetical protein